MIWLDGVERGFVVAVRENPRGDAGLPRGLRPRRVRRDPLERHRRAHRVLRHDPELPDLPDAWSATIEANIFHEAAAGRPTPIHQAATKRRPLVCRCRRALVLLEADAHHERRDRRAHHHAPQRDVSARASVATALDSIRRSFAGRTHAASTADFSVSATPRRVRGRGAQHAARDPVREVESNRHDAEPARARGARRRTSSLYSTSG